MLLTDYSPDDLRFAYCYHAYIRWGTHYAQPTPALATLNPQTLAPLVEPYAIRILECHAEPTSVRVLVSLRPAETLSAGASKLKGQTSKWLRQTLSLQQPTTLLAKGYFACTSGKSTHDQIERYLAGQGEHHGYSERVNPPIFVESFALGPTAEARLQAAHASTRLRFHIVLATWRRRGVFGAEEAKRVTARWRELEREQPFALLKASFLPDHAHVAVATHPRMNPGGLVVHLMNSAQRLIWERFQGAAIQAGIERLWQPSAYLGSYGDLATPEVQQYIRNWAARQAEG